MGLLGCGCESSTTGWGNKQLNVDYRVLTLDGWLEFNHQKWGLSPVKLNLSESAGGRPAVKLVLYTDGKGRIKLPKRNPYMPMTFLPTDTESIPRLSRQWLSVSDMVVKEFRERGVVNAISFPPSIVDVRPWKWGKFQVGVNYSFYIEFPYGTEVADRSVNKQVRKAAKFGYTCERTSEMSGIIECLEDTEERQEFDYRLGVEDLEICQRLLGQDIFRAYVCYAPNGDVASARVILSYPGASAVDWVAGTKRNYLSSGCTQLLISFALEDLQLAGASGFDYAGANISSVAAAKATWGGQLVPYYTIRQPNLRALARHMMDFWGFVRGDRKRR